MAAHRVSSSRVHLERVALAASATTPPGALVLDAGAGDAPYAEHFAGHRYETADFTKSDRIYAEQTFVCDLTEIPVAADRYDLVLCSQVLEHVPEPSAVVAELGRVLRPGGRLWLSAPLFYEEHEQPYDFYRYTQFGLRKLAEDAGLVVDRIEWLEGYLGTFGYQLRLASEQLPRDRRSWGGSRLVAAVARSARPMLWHLGWWLDRLDRAHPAVDCGMPKNYVLVAHKP